MSSSGWTIDWNTEAELDERLKRAVLRSLKKDPVIPILKRFAQESYVEATREGVETEHLLWLDSEDEHAFFVRVWYDVEEEETVVLVEEDNLGDIALILFDSMKCATYGNPDVLKVEFREPDDIGVPP